MKIDNYLWISCRIDRNFLGRSASMRVTIGFVLPSFFKKNFLLVAKMVIFCFEKVDKVSLIWFQEVYKFPLISNFCKA